jgi:hypothetical protein
MGAAAVDGSNGRAVSTVASTVAIGTMFGIAAGVMMHAFGDRY